jgi:hypothetical protein
LPPRPRFATAHVARSLSAALATLGAALALPLAASAQPQATRGPAALWEERPGLTIAFAAGGLYSSLDRAPAGRDGFGFDAATYLGVSAFALGAGYQRTVHTGGAGRSGVYEGLFVEPRLALPLGDVPFTPYVAGRLVRLTPLGGDDDGPRGVQLGGGAGVLVALAPRVRLDLGGSYARVRLDDDRASSNAAQARVGIVVGLGRWAR